MAKRMAETIDLEIMIKTTAQSILNKNATPEQLKFILDNKEEVMDYLKGTNPELFI